MDEKMIMLTPCPFCEGKVRVIDYRLATLSVDIEAECTGCGMEFAYQQDFVATKAARVPCRPSFEELWNRRIKED